MYMSDYDVALCNKLYDFRENFEENNIYSYWIILTLINEIFINEKQEVSVSVKENLKNTLNILLQFYELREDRNIVDWTQPIENVNLSNKDEIIRIINRVFDLIVVENNETDNYEKIKEEPGICVFFDRLVNKINNIINQEHIDLPFETQDEWEEQIKDSLENRPIIPEARPPREDAYHLQKNPKFLKEYVYRTGLIQYKCDNCGLEEWQNEPIGLILDFKDGNHRNQTLSNLRFLCPNCYSQIGKDFK